MVQHDDAKPKITTLPGVKVKALAESDEWADLVPLPDPIDPPDKLPLGIVPTPIRGYVHAESEGLQVNAGMVAVPAMVAAATVIGRALLVEYTRGWTVAPNLWGLVVGQPGTSKSPAISKGWRPLKWEIGRRHDEWEDQKLEVEARRSRLESQREKLQSKIEDPESDTDTAILADEIREIERQLDDLPMPPRCFYTSDATEAALSEILEHQRRGLTLKSDELYGWLKKLEMDNRGGEREFFLSCWSCEDHKTHRISRGETWVKSPTLSVVGGIQPGKLRRLISDATGDGEGADGLLQRFQAPVLANTGTLANFDAERRRQGGATKAVFRRAADTYRSLADLPYPIEDDGGFVLEMTTEAEARLWQWLDGHEERKRRVVDTGEANAAWTAFLAKQPQTFGALVIIIHALECADDDHRTPHDPVDVEVVETAIRWMDYLESHARQLYPPTLTVEHQAMYALAEKIEAGKVEHECTIRGVTRKEWSGLSRRTSDQHTATELVKAAVDQLEGLGWVRLVADRPEGRGQPASRLYLHPDFR